MEYPPLNQINPINNQMEYPPYKQSIKWNIHLINNQSNGISTINQINKQSKWEYPPYKQPINGEYPHYKQSIKCNIHPINKQSMGISSL